MGLGDRVPERSSGGSVQKNTYSLYELLMVYDVNENRLTLVLKSVQSLMIRI